MGRKNVFAHDQELLNKVIQMYDEGIPIHVISKTLYLSDGTIRNELKRIGKFAPKKEIVEKRDRAIMEDYISHNYTCNQLCEKYGLAFSSIDDIIHKFLSDRATLKSEMISIRELVDKDLSEQEILESTAFPEMDVRYIIRKINIRKRIPKAIRECVISDYKQGRKLKDIVNAYYIAPSTLWSILSAAGVQRNHRKPR